MGTPHLNGTATLRTTGWRDVASLLNPEQWVPASSATAYIRMRRTEALGVELAFRLQYLPGDPPGPVTATQHLFVLPVGWRFRNLYTVHGAAQATGAGGFWSATIASLSSAHALQVSTRGSGNWGTGPVISGSARWDCPDSWPAPSDYPGVPWP